MAGDRAAPVSDACAQNYLFIDQAAKQKFMFERHPTMHTLLTVAICSRSMAAMAC